MSLKEEIEEALVNVVNRIKKREAFLKVMPKSIKRNAFFQYQELQMAHKDSLSLIEQIKLLEQERDFLIKERAAVDRGVGQTVETAMLNPKLEQR